MTRLVRRFALAFAALALGLLMAEALLHLCWPTKVMLPGYEIPHWRAGSEVFGRFVEPDAEIGFCPKLDTELVDANGVLRNGYSLQKPAGVSRLLFLGDSVTARGHIVAALASRYGPKYEYWNAGFESFNTTQEVVWYFRHNQRVAPDHVILTLHPNDFSTVLVAIYDEAGRLAMYSSKRRIVNLNAWLFRHSEIYRRVFLARVDAGQDDDFAAAAAEVRAALLRLRDGLAEAGVRFSVVLLPTMLPPSEWSESDTRARDAALALTRELGLRAFDLRPALEDAIRRGIDIQESKGDSWHPSAALAAEFAQALARSELLP